MKNKRISPLSIIVVLLLLAGLALYHIFGNSNQRNILGCWTVEQSGTESGFQCGKEGLAASINNPTKQYNKWKISKGMLILEGKLFDDYRIIQFSDSLHIKHLNKEILLVEQNGTTTKYHKTR